MTATKHPRITELAGFLTPLARVGLGILFIWAALQKLQQPYDFLSTVYSYDLVGPRLGLSIAFVLPWLELVLGISLVTAVLQRGALLLSTLLLAVFTCARFSAASRDLLIPC